MERFTCILARSIATLALSFPAMAAATTLVSPGDNNCWGIEVRNDSIERQQFTVTLALQDSATLSNWSVILEPGQSVFRPIRSAAKACLGNGDIHLQGETTARIAETGEIGVDRYEDPKSIEVIESWLEGQERIQEEAAAARAREAILDSQVVSLAEAHRIAEQVQAQLRALLLKAAADERLRTMRSQHPGCIINEDADLALCVNAERQIRLDDIEEARKKAAEQAQIDKQAIEALRVAEIARAKADYMDRAKDDLCWAATEFPRFYPEQHVAGEGIAQAALINQAQHWWTIVKAACAASRSQATPSTEPVAGMQFDRTVSFKDYLLLGMVALDHLPGAFAKSNWAAFTASNPNMAVMIQTHDPMEKLVARIKSGEISSCHLLTADEKRDLASQAAKVDAIVSQAAGAAQNGNTSTALLDEAQALMRSEGVFIRVAANLPAYSCRPNL